MKLQPHEILTLKDFHNRYWSVNNIVLKKKPDIEKFMELKSLFSNRIKTILSLYFFNFWSLKNALYQPETREIVATFKDYN